MKFINGRLIRVGNKADGELLLNYNGLLKPDIKIEWGIESKESGFYLNTAYKIVVLTENYELLNRFTGEYNFEIERNGDDLNSSRKSIFSFMSNAV